ncbi:FxSxx-COOH cyclophane-containing RiPP peptide [Streptomyces sp. NPDC058864]
MTESTPQELPDFSRLDLETLRTLDHPVLSDLLERLTDRQDSAAETLWGFNNAVPR